MYGPQRVIILCRADEFFSQALRAQIKIAKIEAGRAVNRLIPGPVPGAGAVSRQGWEMTVGEATADNGTSKACKYCRQQLPAHLKDCPIELMETQERMLEEQQFTKVTVPPVGQVWADKVNEQAKADEKNKKDDKSPARSGPEVAVAAPSLPDDALVGTVFAEKYEIMSVLGKGGMSLVYKARHKFMNRVVAVKVLLEALVTDTGAVQRFQQESQAASTLDHQNVVTVYDFGQTPNGQAYFVMDCLEGESLSDLIERNGRVEVGRALNIFEQICDGLNHAHKKGIIHRDLKPNNIVLMRGDDGQENVKIVDFGIAKIISTDGSPQQRLTQTGEIFGSPFYMSPEQCQGFPLDARSDLYSLGCLMYETLTGYPPQMGESFVATALKHINDPPIPFLEMAPSAQIPRQVESVVFRCLEKNPKERYSSAEQVRQAIMDAGLAGGVPGLRAGAVKVTQSQSSMRQTFDKLGRVFDTGSHRLSKDKKRVVSMAKLLFMVVPLALFGIGFGVVYFYPGPESDRGTPWNKLMWQFALDNANRAASRNDYKEALKQISQAELLTKTFHDGNARLKATVQEEAEIYGKFDEFDKQRDANRRFAELNLEDTLREVKHVEKWLSKIGDEANANSSISSAGGAVANANHVIMTAKKLHTRAMYEREETLLRKAVFVFNRLGLKDNEHMADFKTNLADCLAAQQKSQDVRPLLADALRIRQAIAGIDDYNNLPKLEGDDAPYLNLVRSTLKLGEFDRDQSSYDEATRELVTAKKLISVYFKRDKELNDECKNSILDLQRQEVRAKTLDAKAPPPN